MTLNVAAASPLGNTPALQRSAAVQRTLGRIDCAGERVQVDAALVRQMTSAFTQFQSAAGTLPGDGDDGGNGKPSPVAAPAADTPKTASASHFRQGSHFRRQPPPTATWRTLPRS